MRGCDPLRRPGPAPSKRAPGAPRRREEGLQRLVLDAFLGPPFANGAIAIPMRSRTPPASLDFGRIFLLLMSGVCLVTT